MYIVVCFASHSSHSLFNVLTNGSGDKGFEKTDLNKNPQ